MRSAPTHRAAGKRARRFLAASLVSVIRTFHADVRRISAPDIWCPRAPILAAGATGYEPRAFSRSAERWRLATPSARGVPDHHHQPHFHMNLVSHAVSDAAPRSISYF